MYYSEIACIYYKNFLKTVSALRVNKTKLTSGNNFAVDLLALGGENESKILRRYPFRELTHISVFSDYF